MVNNNNIIENQLLLGLLPLLGGTSNLTTAFIIGFSSLIIAVLMKFVYHVFVDFIKSESYWVLLIAIGFSLSYSLYLIFPALSPYLGDFVDKYLLLVGLTPLIYYGCNNKVSWNQFFNNIAIFLILMFTTGLIREFLAQGTILEYTLIENPLVTIVDGPIGAFVVLGSIGLIAILLFGSESDTSVQKEGGN